MLVGRQARQQYIAKIQKLISDYPVIGIAGFRGIPALQLQQLRAKLRPDVEIKVSRNKLLKLALQRSGLDMLCNYIQDQTALIASKIPGLKLMELLESSKQDYPLKPGAAAPQDIYVEAGPTKLKPGPIVGELQVLGIPAAVEKGKVVIRERKLVLKQGQRASPALANALSQLGIKPMRVGLDLRAFVEDGCLFTKEHLAMLDRICSELSQGIQCGLNLAFGIGYPHPYILPQLIRRAWLEGMGLGLGICFYDPQLIPYIIFKSLKIAYSLNLGEMECIYAALLLHTLGKPINEQNLTLIFESIGASVDKAKIKLLVSALAKVNLDELIKQQTGMLIQAPMPAPVQEPKKPAVEEKKEKKEEEKKPEEETSLAGLEALFG